LGEIEAILTRHPASRQGVVVVWESRPNDKQLAAYYVPNAEASPTPDELGRFTGKEATRPHGAHDIRPAAKPAADTQWEA